ncbi:MAG TPA: YbaB/EbfC family nucleoid-associated protein [Candidatus Kapabacteria bacterium]|jgi:DNA-binding YbaB/EbfC family protein|nr:YbaB/EbfC family nucleoid-associated protein [Candidatus Kapabacteria bacterium]
MNFDFSSISKAAERFKAGMESMREQANKTLVTGESGGGLVKVTMNGTFTVQSIEIDDSLLSDKAILQDLIVAAFNKAHDKAEKSMQEQMSSLTGGLSIPGMPF